MLGDVVELIETEGVSIFAVNRATVLYVWGAIDEEQVEPMSGETNKDELLLNFSSATLTSVPNSVADRRATSATKQQIMFFVAGMILVFILLAVPLKSYGQPLIIMSVIPFSMTGAIWGHFLLGLDLSMMSTFGLIVTGVVINDSLVMTDFINQRRRQGMAIKEGRRAGCARFRAITLTSIQPSGCSTIMYSLQATFVIPWQSAGFAVMYATLVTWCSYLVCRYYMT